LGGSPREDTSSGSPVEPTASIGSPSEAVGSGKPRISGGKLGIFTGIFRKYRVFLRGISDFFGVFVQKKDGKKTRWLSLPALSPLYYKLVISFQVIRKGPRWSGRKWFSKGFMMLRLSDKVMTTEDPIRIPSGGG